MDGEFTDLEAALNMAMALFPEDAAKRVVIITDGNENLGDAMKQATRMASSGVGIDVVPIRLASRSDVSVEKVVVPSDVRQGQPFDVRVVLHNNSPNETIKGRLKLVRKTGEEEKLMGDSPVELSPGKTVISTDAESPETIDQPDFYTYSAEFTPDVASDDAQSKNNEATAFTHVRGRGQVLLIEDWQNPGEFDHLVEELRKEELEVTTISSEKLFTNLAQLQRYDTVILANVPRSSGDDLAGVTHFSDVQIRMLVTNTEQMGAGLIMLGGANSFGAGGWINTEIEKAMPVSFQIDNAKIAPVGALCLIMHASEMAQGNYWQKVVTKESIKALGQQDYCGLLHWGGGGDVWLWNKGFARVGSNRGKMLARVDTMTPGDMPDFDPSMKKAAAAFAALPDAAVKHMIIISDGDATAPKASTLNLLTNIQVQDPPVVVTTVAVGSHGSVGTPTMKRIAAKTGGKYYKVNNAKALPRIYQREIRRLARPLVFLKSEGVRPAIVQDHEIVREVTAPPPITGFVLTTARDNPLAEVLMKSPLPTGDRNNTILATWTYGLGRTVAWTTDTGETSQGWASKWKDWPDYRKLFSKMVRWSMRPVDESQNFMVATDTSDGKVRVIINAWDKDDEYLDFLSMRGSIVGPDMLPREIDVKQVAPGRYMGEFDAIDAGSYMILVNPGQGNAPIRTGINVPYSAEYRDRQENLALLSNIAKLPPVGGKPGMLIEDEENPAGSINSDAVIQKFNSFRHDLPRATSPQDIWPSLLLLGGCLFFFDIFFRRVQVNFDWLARWLVQARDHFMQREPAAVPDATMSRLRSRKAEVAGRIQQRQAAARFEPTASEAGVEPLVAEVESQTPTSTSEKKAEPGFTAEKEQEDDSYTSRLLKAKRDVWNKKGKK